MRGQWGMIAAVLAIMSAPDALAASLVHVELAATPAAPDLPAAL